jgi:SAM-dependent methyltransferase
MDNALRLEDFWRREAIGYARRTLPPECKYRQEWAAFLLTLTPEKILEVGCNEGQNLLAVHILSPHVKLYGCDIAPVGFDSPIKFRVASAYNLPYKDNFVDLVTTHGLLMHLPPESVGKAVSELIRVSSKHIVIREDVEIEGDGSYCGEPNAIFIHDYKSLFKNTTPKEYSIKHLEGRRRATGVFKKILQRIKEN